MKWQFKSSFHDSCMSTQSETARMKIVVLSRFLSSQSIAFDKRCLMLMHSFLATSANSAITYILLKTKFLGYISVTDNMPIFNHFDIIGPKATEFRSVMQTTAITPIKVIQGHQFGYQSKTHM